MLIYFLLLAYPALFALTSAGRSARSNRHQLWPIVGFWIFYNFISAFRDNTGGDWFQYEEITYGFNLISLSQAMSEVNPGFAFFSWCGVRLGLGLYFTDFICSAILSFGIFRLAYRLPSPWLAISAAVPYLLIVVGMGYLRQAAAIGFMISAICDLQDRRNGRATLQMLFAMSFHPSSVVMAPLLIFASAPKNFWTVGAMVAGTLVLANLALSTETAQLYQKGYIDASYQSSGATIRIAMNIVPAVIFMFFRRTIFIEKREKQIWELFAWASIALAVMLVTSSSSTAVDRIALYLLPIQVYVFGHLAPAIAGRGRLERLVTLGCIGYFATVQFVWLFYADHAYLWVPYQSIFSDQIIPSVFRGDG